MDWYAVAQEAEERGAWDVAIAAVQPHAECFSRDHVRHNAHLWYLDLLARAGRRAELESLAPHDSCARRRLTRLAKRQAS
ncbi:hypothetical protein Cs7R123_72260 [Catellatospora sp. TT07R-123]|uniref:hypothetical protein n=1 Tax=Catellatospora sp. TT07R-123 TaxID=2733863 RepID=UPI001B240DC4|nr:hypothetical protein [Catellatospora sp. TT07R-123]GHJ49884.1 hypothetical protein Cs7R123_72260 [Catellatospora sp. TT07R-123]